MSNKIGMKYPLPLIVNHKRKVCPICKGRGYEERQRCGLCRGRGTVERRLKRVVKA